MIVFPRTEKHLADLEQGDLAQSPAGVALGRRYHGDAAHDGHAAAVRRGSSRAGGDLLQQVAAIKGAITGLTNELIEEQLTQHVLPEGYDEQELDRFLKLLRKYG